MFRMVNEVSTIIISAPQAAALAIVQNIKNIEKTEVKADEVIVHPETPTKGTYWVRGHFAGVPWTHIFAYELNEQGFHSQEATPPASGTRISGGFIVEPLGEGACKIVHYEDYKLSWWMLPLKPLISWYLQWSMRKELRDLREMVLAEAERFERPRSGERAFPKPT
jgi:hypothetical protein